MHPLVDFRFFPSTVMELDREKLMCSSYFKVLELMCIELMMNE